MDKNANTKNAEIMLVSKKVCTVIMRVTREWIKNAVYVTGIPK